MVVQNATALFGRTEEKGPGASDRPWLDTFFSSCSQVRKVSWEDKGGRQIKQKVRSVQVQRTPSIWIKTVLCTFVKKKKKTADAVLVLTYPMNTSCTQSVSPDIYLRCIYTFLHICVAMTIDCSYRGMQPCQHVSVYLHTNRCKLLYLCGLFFFFYLKNGPKE